MPRTESVARLLALAAATELYAARVQAAAMRLEAVPPTTIEDLVAEKRRTGSLFSGRRLPVEGPLLTVQIECRDSAVPLYVGLDATELASYVAAYERSLRLIGMRSGDTLALYDFGSSPVVYLASGLYAPGGGIGAADCLSSVVICNDGVPNLARRMVEIVRYVRPRVLVIREDCVEPFAAAAATLDLDSRAAPEIVAVTVEDGAIRGSRKAELERRLGRPIHRIARSDLALFVAAECPACGCVHVPADLYEVDAVQAAGAGRARIVVTALCAASFLSLRIATTLEGSITGPGCSRGPSDVRIRLE